MLLNFFSALHSKDPNLLLLNETILERHGGRWVHTDIEKLRQYQIYPITLQNQSLFSENAKVLFVRDPLDRIVSAWRDKFGPLEFAASPKVKQIYYVSCFMMIEMFNNVLGLGILWKRDSTQV